MWSGFPVTNAWDEVLTFWPPNTQVYRKIALSVKDNTMPHCTKPLQGDTVSCQVSYCHRIMESEQFLLEGTFKDRLATSPQWPETSWMLLRMGHLSTTSLGILCQGFTILTVKKSLHYKIVSLRSAKTSPAQAFAPIFLISSLKVLRLWILCNAVHYTSLSTPRQLC